MPLAIVYDYATVKAAIDRAEGHWFSSFITVYGATDYDWDVQEFKDKQGNVRFRKDIFKGPREQISSDVGHTLRNHVKSHQADEYIGEKSRYNDLYTCVSVTMELLNSAGGQIKLQSLDAGDAGMDRKITENIAGNWYGDKGDGATKKVERASCTIMKLGTNTLWVHTSYPTNFID
jgi:hypothetical protein